MTTTKPHLAERVARGVVDATRAVARRRIASSVIGLIVALVAAGLYIATGSLGVHPLRSTISVKVLLRESGGLLPNQDVTFRGVPVGRVRSVNFTPGGVQATAEIDSSARVPMDSRVSVSALSPAGEQYLNFRPNGSNTQPMADGTVITEDKTSIPVSLAKLLGDADGMLSQLDPEKLRVITDELRVSGQGPEKLAALLDGGAFLISTVDSIMPQTMSILRNSRTVLTMLNEATPGLQRTSDNLNRTMAGVSVMDGGFRTLMDRGGAPLATLDGIIADNSDTMVQLLGNLTTVAQVASARVPALEELINSQRGGSALGAITKIIHDQHVWVVVDIYPRYGCDYDVPALPPFLPNYPEPYLYTYCNNPDPSVLVRGARNAPRPPGDDTAGPPLNYDRLAQTVPTPQVNSSIPTPFGGPTLPVQLPPDPPDWPRLPFWPGSPPRG
ncbi:MlaD family protein [Mycobacteroides abscessus]|uniref:MlaD family protein n=1 Tax=Mycobacteroides abscessus TaxID=36809 RepID=UPI0009286702|nr:MlaD family protein [Mycobacteroides abscessus]MDO3333930.1 MlaD family protein [Mycobacteroides abscessus subsp. bolletii]QSM86860.1 MCE family protein [Mycobacteroides abscessus subsp. bolletii]SIB90267.1 Mce family protein Mce5F [Mycobacteroides abscessus subsp. bolletii]SKS87351.1 Mce family protein Mce5F [Mycobacteroides abscessus subsp. bolletii]SKT10774.1 Mce family protein Mce5F [Mycobacteroides abscessus subsp. bolletii]